ncbi:MAG: hypothetical protein HWQ40_35515 [Nostoc sp. NMS9]|nr:hypothetical protein [Nostoc sp. NMS9]
MTLSNYPNFIPLLLNSADKLTKKGFVGTYCPPGCPSPGGYNSGCESRSLHKTFDYHVGDESDRTLQGTTWSAGNGPRRGWSPNTRLTVRNSRTLIIITKGKSQLLKS